MNLSFVRFSINCISAFIEKEQEKDLQLFLTLLETLLGFKLLHKTSVTGRALTDVLTFTHTNKSIDFYKIYTFIWFYCSYSIYNYSRSLNNAIIFIISHKKMSIWRMLGTKKYPTIKSKKVFALKF